MDMYIFFYKNLVCKNIELKINLATNCLFCVSNLKKILVLKVKVGDGDRRFVELVGLFDVLNTCLILLVIIIDSLLVYILLLSRGTAELNL